jgi:carboxymethylenebutenolidase
MLCLKGETTMKQLGKFEKYLIEEFYDDYREGLLSRRSFIRRVVAVVCHPIEVPAADAPVPEAETPEATEEPA